MFRFHAFLMLFNRLIQWLGMVRYISLFKRFGALLDVLSFSTRTLKNMFCDIWLAMSRAFIKFIKKSFTNYYKFLCMLDRTCFYVQSASAFMCVSLALSASVSHTKTIFFERYAKTLMSCSTSSGNLPRSLKCFSRFTVSSPSLPLIQKELRLDNRSSFFLRHNYRFRLFCSWGGAGEKLRNKCLQRNIVNVVTSKYSHECIER